MHRKNPSSPTVGGDTSLKNIYEYRAIWEDGQEILLTHYYMSI